MSEPTAHQNNPILCKETLRIQPSELEALANELDQESNKSTGAKCRRNTRVKFHTAVAVLIQINHSDISYKAKSRDISNSGVSILLGEPIRPGTPCVTTLVTAEKRGVKSTGSIIRCRQVKNGVYDIGIQFEQPIDVNALLPGAIPTAQTPEKPPPTTNPNP
jgi:hypothetical protein